MSASHPTFADPTARVSKPGAQNPDLLLKCREFVVAPQQFDEAARCAAAELLQQTSPLCNAGPWIEDAGGPMLQFSTNDYLGLAMHPAVRERAAEVAAQFGIGMPMGSRLMTGNTAWHEALEVQLAAFKRTEAALTFSAGSMAMIGAMACLAGRNDLLILDERAHASLVLGAKASGAELRFFRHNDVAHLDSVLSRTADANGRAIVVDGVYSMDGDLAPLDEIVRLKHKHGVRLIVDDAHGTGVFGDQGRGTAAHFAVEDEVDLHAGTFSKAVGTVGGFLAGAWEVITYLRFRAPTFVFTKSMPAVVVAATSLALELLEAADEARQRLWRNTQRLQEGLRAAGMNLGRTQSPITPVPFTGNAALHVAARLRHHHRIWVAPVVYPAAPLGRSLIRLTPTAAHGDDDIDRMVAALTESVRAVGAAIAPVDGRG